MAGRGGISAVMVAWLMVGLAMPASASSPLDVPGVAAAAPIEPREPIDANLSEDADLAVRWVTDNQDNHGLPFVVVDKKRARLYVFAASGRLVGDSQILLGLAVGDTSIAGIASRTPVSLAPAERTTPAGRFASEPGHNAKGEDIVWFDYDASLAIHRLRPSPASQRRDERMESTLTDDKRISYGCIVVPVAFYDAVVRPSLGRQRGIVYVLPETRPVAQMFRSDALSSRAP